MPIGSDRRSDPLFGPVIDRFAPSWWVLADTKGNEACMGTLDGPRVNDVSFRPPIERSGIPRYCIIVPKQLAAVARWREPIRAERPLAIGDICTSRATSDKDGATSVTNDSPTATIM